MKKLYYLLFAAALAVGSVSCNDEWEDEQYAQMPSFDAAPNAQGVTAVYVRYVPGGERRYNLPLILSGSTMNTHDRTIHVGIDNDTLKSLNHEHYGDREELYFRQMPKDYYSFPSTVEIPKGEWQALLPIDFKQGGADGNTPLDQADKWVLPITILDDESYDYTANPRKYYRKALLRYTPFNDYSGYYTGTQLKIEMAGAPEGDDGAMYVDEHRSFVVDENTIFFFMGQRDIDYLDRKHYKVFVEFTDEDMPGAQLGAKRLRLYSDNAEKNKFVGGNMVTKVENGTEVTTFEEGEAYYVMMEEMDDQEVYTKHIYITLYLAYKFVDYDTVPGTELEYTVSGNLSLQRDLNTLIPDEDQQIQW